jgi:hypothetical protein
MLPMGRSGALTGGLVTMAMMFVVGALSNRVQPKYLIIAGPIVIAVSMYDLPLIFLPIMTASLSWDSARCRWR